MDNWKFWFLRCLEAVTVLLLVFALLRGGIFSLQRDEETRILSLGMAVLYLRLVGNWVGRGLAGTQ